VATRRVQAEFLQGELASGLLGGAAPARAQLAGPEMFGGVARAAAAGPAPRAGRFNSPETHIRWACGSLNIHIPACQVRTDVCGGGGGGGDTFGGGCWTADPSCWAVC
jgi:hypothetical protein